MTDPRTPGQWNAWVEQSRGRAQQGQRYREVPVDLQAQVAGHMRTVAALARKAGARARAAR